jgi:hypothetical protein
MRALGGLSRSLTANFSATEEGRGVALSIIASLCSNLGAGPVKNRWNAAHAFGTLLSNPNVPFGEDATAADAVVQLLAVIETSSNFKVRINAASAFAVPTDRRKFGSPALLGRVVATLVAALDTIDSMEDFAEYKYQATLQEQLSLTLFHVLHLADPAHDLTEVSQAVSLRREVVDAAMALVLTAQSEPAAAMAEDDTAPERAVHRYFSKAAAVCGADGPSLHVLPPILASVPRIADTIGDDRASSPHDTTASFTHAGSK